MGFRYWAEQVRPADTVYAVATGRCVSEARRLVADYDLPLPELWITSVGSEIWRADENGKLALCEDFARFISDGWDAGCVEECAGQLNIEAQAPHEQRTFKRSFVGTADQSIALRNQLQRHGAKAEIIFSHGKFIDVLPARAGKGAALAFAASQLGLTLKDTTAAGNSGNDDDLLAAASQSIVVANADKDLKQQIGRYRAWLASKPYANGVLEGLTHFGWTTRNAAQQMSLSNLDCKRICHDI